MMYADLVDEVDIFLPLQGLGADRQVMDNPTAFLIWFARLGEPEKKAVKLHINRYLEPHYTLLPSLRSHLTQVSGLLS